MPRPLPITLAPALLAMLVFFPHPSRAAPAAALPLEATAVSNTALLRRVMALVSARAPRDRATAARRMGVLLDPRSPRILWYVAEHDRSSEVAVGATRALGRAARLGSEPSRTILGLLALARREDTAAAAIDELGRLAPDARAFDMLLSTARRTSLSAGRRKQAIAVLRKGWPRRRAGLPRLAGPSALPTLVGAAAGAYTLAAVGRWAKSDSGDVFGGLTGALIGGGTGYLLGRELTLADQVRYSTALTWGILGGELLARTVVTRPKTRIASTFGVGTELAFALVAYQTADSLERSAGDLAFANLAATAGLMLGNGLVEATYHKTSTRSRNGLALAGTLGGLLAGTAIAPGLRLTRGDMALIGYATFEGVWFGSGLGDLADKTLSERRSDFWDAHPRARELPANLQHEDPNRLTRDGQSAGMLLGPALGFAVGTAISQYTDLQPSDSAQMLVFGGYGKLLGAGLALLSGTGQSDRVNAAHLAGGLVGIVAGAATTDSLQFRDGDLALVPLATGWGFFHGFAVAAFTEQAGLGLSDDQRLGITLTTAAGLGIGAMAFAQEYELTNLEATMGSTGAFWGAWIAGWTSGRLHRPFESTMLAAAVGGDLGALATGLLISPAFDLDPLVLAGASFGGLSLAGLVTLVTAMGTTDGDAMISANIAGSAVGLIAGGLLAQMWLDRRGSPSSSGGRLGRGAGESDGGAREDDGFALPVFAGAPVMDEGRLVGVSVQLSGNW